MMVNLHSIAPLRFTLRDVVDDSVTIEKPFPLSIFIPVVIIIVLSVLAAPILCCIFCCCRSRRRKNNTAENKRQYLRARASKPGLTYKMWAARKKQAAADAEKARRNLIQQPNGDLDFPMLPDQDRDAMKEKRPGVMSVIGMFFFAFVAIRKHDKAMAKTVAKNEAAKHGTEDEEMLVGEIAEAGKKLEVMTPAKTRAWGSDVPPAYSTISLEDL